MDFFGFFREENASISYTMNQGYYRWIVIGMISSIYIYILLYYYISIYMSVEKRNVGKPQISWIWASKQVAT